jgi:hypothetical protein
MKCFLHRDVDAVGTCRSCGRGLCPSCVALAGNKLACHGACHADVLSLDRWISRSRGWRYRAYRVSAVLLGLLALGALVPAVFGGPRDRPWGIGFAVFFGLMLAVRIGQLRRMTSEARHDASVARSQAPSDDGAASTTRRP